MKDTEKLDVGPVTIICPRGCRKAPHADWELGLWRRLTWVASQLHHVLAIWPQASPRGSTEPQCPHFQNGILHRVWGRIQWETVGETPRLVCNWVSKKWYLSRLSILSVLIVDEAGQHVVLNLHPLMWSYWLWATKSTGSEGGGSWAPPGGERGLQTMGGEEGNGGNRYERRTVRRKTG